MYAGSWDTRFKAAVPVCSVGNYQSYLGAACCMCEVVPGALQFTEEDAILGLTAPHIKELVEMLLKHPHEMDSFFQKPWNEASDETAKMRVIIDQVAALTDPGAYALHARVCVTG
jgi:hypothetical protein